ncbi:MAG: alcohol dehydrogenase catalytic domain-containing protein [Gemmatimonadetes bacterium]|nr:alcohol dehydrogenase catalytic domain-containing protein [Gemmatimonadota bacterium]
MTAAVLVRPGLVELRELPVPEPGPGELVLHVEAALTCGTDIKTFQRGHPKIPLPLPMGHEFAGVVAAAGSGVRGFREGDAVACVPTAPCGACRLCRRGRENLCPEAVGRMVFGGFAEYVRLPQHLVAASVFDRPATLSAEAAAALEPVACVVHGADRVALDRAETVVLLGDGPIALLFLQLARRRGAGRVLVAGKHAVRLEAARELGADAVVDVGRDSLQDAVREWTGGTGGDVVIECVGRPQVWEAAAGLAASGGELLLYGGCAAGSRVRFDAYRIHYEEVDVKGAFHYGRADVRRALELLLSGEVRVLPLITHRESLDRLEQALELVLAREAIKVAIRP